MKTISTYFLKLIFLIAITTYSIDLFSQPAGFGATVSSVTSTPTSVIQNNNPKLVGSIKNTSLSTNGYNGEATFDIIAKITYPNSITFQYIWDNQSFTYNQTKSFTFPTGNFSTATTGSYTIDYTVYTNDRGYTYQSKSTTFSVTASKPDLIIRQYPTLSSSSVIAGNSVTAYYDVINQGNATAGSSSTSLHLSAKNYYDATATYLADNAASSLSAGSSRSYSKSITIPASTPAGNYYILVSADGGLAVTESNESNQTTYVAITVTASKPDLIIRQYPTLSSSSVIAGNSVTAYYDVINQGNATAGSSSTSLHLSAKNYYDATATYLADNAASSLSAGSSRSYSKSITIPASTPAGNYYILVSADGGLAVTESNESNQTTYVAITVTASKPDLIIRQYPTLSSSSVIAGNSVTAYYDVINQGNATAGSSSTSLHLSAKNYYDATATYLADNAASSLSAGSSRSYSKSITIPASTPAGNYYILVSADGGLAVTESNESNQTTYVAITVTASKPDLIIKEFPTLSSSSVIAGNSVTAYYDVINQGNATAGSSSTSLHLSAKNYYDATATYLADNAASSLSAGSSQSYSKSITIPASTPAGNYYLLVSADGGLAVTESNESNQTTYVAITVTVAKPDLIIKEFPTLNVSSVIAGGNVTVSYDVINQGNATAGSSSTSLHLSAKNYYDATATYLADNAASSLSAGSSQSYSKSITISASTPAGNYYLLVSADGGLAVTESNESNQTTYVAITVTVAKPDLIIKEFPTLNVSSVIAGGNVTVSYDVINQGNATAGSSSTSLHLSTKNYYDATATYLADYSVSSLSAGSSQSYSKSITIPASTPAGNYYLLVSADGGLAVTESNESNQTTYVAITVTNQNSISQITWSGYTWDVRPAGNGNPGSNNWLNTTDNIWVDNAGNLHLKITKVGDKWYSSEIYSQESFGYGEYTFQTLTNVENLDKNIVFGLFTYETDTKEVDIEFSKWGNTSNKEGNFTVQPSNSNSTVNYPLNLTGGLSDCYSTHKFQWFSSGINFQSYYGHYSNLPSIDKLIKEWTYTGANVPTQGNEKVHLNFWLYKQGVVPSDQLEAEVIIKSFSFKKIDNSISISSTNIPTWQREGDDFSGSVTVDLSKAGANSTWYLEADYFNSNGYQGAIIYPSLTASTATQNFSTTTDSQLKAQAKQGNYFTWNVVLESNKAHSTALLQTKIIEKKWDKKNIFYYNNAKSNLKLPLKHIDGAESVRIVFSIDGNTSICNTCLSSFDILKLNSSKNNAIYSVQVNKIGSSFFAELPVSNDPSNGSYKVSVDLNYATSNIGSSDARPGEYFYAIDYLKSNGTNNLYHEEGKVDLTKFGLLGNLTNNDTTVVFIGGNRNTIESDFTKLNTNPTLGDDFSIANNLRYGNIGEINANYNTWYIGQGNANFIENNAYDIGVALDSIVKLTNNPKEIHLIAHSFGGIQVRTMLGYGGRRMDGVYDGTKPGQTTLDKIKTVTFLSSPHRGITVGSWSYIAGNAADEMKDDSYFVKTTLKNFTIPNLIKIINVTGINTDLINPSDGVVDVSSSAKPELITSLGTNKTINQYYIKKNYPQIFVWNILNAHSMTHHTDIISDQTFCSSENSNDIGFSVLNRIFYYIRGGNESNTAIQEITANSAIKLFPNPVQNELFIQSEIPISQVTIYTLEGMQIKIIFNYTTNSKIELSSLSAGVYLVRLMGKDGSIFTGKFIKE